MLLKIFRCSERTGAVTTLEDFLSGKMHCENMFPNRIKIAMLTLFITMNMVANRDPGLCHLHQLHIHV